MTKFIHQSWLKSLLLTLKIIGVSVGTLFLALYLLPKEGHLCSGVNYFVSSHEPLDGLCLLLRNISVTVLLWTMGSFLYAITSIPKYVNLYIYFIVLTIGSMSLIIKSALSTPQKLVPSIAQDICKKSTDDGTQITFNNLTQKEYTYLNAKDQWMPKIPEAADSINILYFHESFLGDYDLSIDFALPDTIKLDTLAFPNWIVNGTRYSFNRYVM